MSFSPIITPSSTPIVSISPSITPSPATVTATNISYQQILASLGTFVYGSEFIYMATTSYTQIGQAMQYIHFDSNGNQIQTYLPFAVDPYQSQPAIYFETNSQEVVFDGFSSLTFDLQPNTTVYFKVFVLVEGESIMLNALHKDEFQKLEEAEGVSFFKDFCNYLIDE